MDLVNVGTEERLGVGRKDLRLVEGHCAALGSVDQGDGLLANMSPGSFRNAESLVAAFPHRKSIRVVKFYAIGSLWAYIALLHYLSCVISGSCSLVSRRTTHATAFYQHNKQAIFQGNHIGWWESKRI